MQKMPNEKKNSNTNQIKKKFFLINCHNHLAGNVPLVI